MAVPGSAGGVGCLPWPEILRRLRTAGYRGFVSVEAERRWYPDELPPAEETMGRGFAYLRSLLGARA